jgi:hypothetical protein
LVLAGDLARQHAGNRRIDAVRVEVDELQVVLAREQPDGVDIGHGLTIGTILADIERLPATVAVLGRRPGDQSIVPL